MSYTLEEKYKLIFNDILGYAEKNPLVILESIMHKDFIDMHGPEHHFLDGATFLAAYKNCGGDINLKESLIELAKRTYKMPGCMCGYRGICGSVSSLGSALSIIHKTTPISDDKYYADNMEYTSFVIELMSKIGGPRCCKRNAYISVISAVEFVRKKYNISMDIDNIYCEFFKYNKQCIQDRCPFHRKRDEQNLEK